MIWSLERSGKTTFEEGGNCVRRMKDTECVYISSEGVFVFECTVGEREVDFDECTL